ncbi:hypothetical protein P9101_01395 [Gallibacterium anatis]|uniref:Uncharacterized protein n=4 Tax=Gallibacterium TaxID=155493 RepID=U1GYM2_9PAST|nr:hypothetical protein N561_12400 [Gallibacterium anatis 12656/12]KGQ36026.1 hypothetical protein JP34_00630 [Gallibacterium anatis]KGQ36443.1 hypothetical protein JP36_09915 [Gallibacterium genomosp. 1]KGQ41693.1 hypothetical protein JP30_04125 [Gallibacterium anatis IPDH697-78]KGQ50497.1 hypothetical protein JL12_05225 [Gallibacterium anatis 10672-6]KGQ58057.1 hypothetical protein IO48_12810 [Gallibacterium anatis 4895]
MFRNRVLIFFFVFIFIFLIIFFKIFFIEFHRKIEEEKGTINLIGICEKTGTNLYLTLGKEMFYELVKRNFIDYLRNDIKEHSEKHYKICEKEKCGMYYLEENNKNIDRFIDDFKILFVSDGITSEDYQGKYVDIVNNPRKILIEEMGMRKLNVKENITKNSGFFYVQYFYGGTVFLINRDVNNNFFSFLELQDRRNSVTYGELEGYRLSYEEERKKGIGNFYIRLSGAHFDTQGFYTTLRHPSSLSKFNDLIPITNCGY